MGTRKIFVATTRPHRNVKTGHCRHCSMKLLFLFHIALLGSGLWVVDAQNLNTLYIGTTTNLPLYNAVDHAENYIGKGLEAVYEGNQIVLYESIMMHGTWPGIIRRRVVDNQVLSYNVLRDLGPEVEDLTVVHPWVLQLNSAGRQILVHEITEDEVLFREAIRLPPAIPTSLSGITYDPATERFIVSVKTGDIYFLRMETEATFDAESTLPVSDPLLSILPPGGLHTGLYFRIMGSLPIQITVKNPRTGWNEPVAITSISRITLFNGHLYATKVGLSCMMKINLARGIVVEWLSFATGSGALDEGGNGEITGLTSVSVNADDTNTFESGIIFVTGSSWTKTYRFETLSLAGASREVFTEQTCSLDVFARVEASRLLASTSAATHSTLHWLLVMVSALIAIWLSRPRAIEHT